MSESGAMPQFDLEAMTKQWQDMMMDGWSKATKQMVGSDSFAATSNAYLDWALSWQKQMRNNTGQFLDSLEFPKRSDVARISKQVAAVELRIAEMEDRLDKMTGLLGAISGAMQKMVEQSIASQAPAPASTPEAPPVPAEVKAKVAPKRPVAKKKG